MNGAYILVKCIHVEVLFKLALFACFCMLDLHVQ